ncbi:MAG: hypothetical protein J2P50_13290 [Hyphomicrobiaceae bacterium]|nr:hypothetical protein [Hyphomicrobiaceae bacterium]
MGFPSPLDTAILAPAAILGLMGLWLGFGRSLVAWPMRWLWPLIGSYLAGRLAELYVLINWDRAALVNLVGLAGVAVPSTAFVIAFLVALIGLVMFMGNLRERIAVWTARRRIGLLERAMGGLAGIACAMLVAFIVVADTPVGHVLDNKPAWVQGSAVLPYIRGALDELGRPLSPYLPPREHWQAR